MCGRYYLDEQLKDDLTRWVIIPDGHIFPYGDIHPGEEGFIILKGHYGDYKTWGYPLDQKRVFNARIETVLEKKMFKEDAVKRRCIIPISGFYEWDRAHTQYRFTNHHILYLAGIYQDDYFTILTKEAEDIMSGIHSRMPVIVSFEDIDLWLNEGRVYKKKQRLFRSPWFS